MMRGAYTSVVRLRMSPPCALGATPRVTLALHPRNRRRRADPEAHRRRVAHDIPDAIASTIRTRRSTDNTSPITTGLHPRRPVKAGQSQD